MKRANSTHGATVIAITTLLFRVLMSSHKDKVNILLILLTTLSLHVEENDYDQFRLSWVILNNELESLNIDAKMLLLIASQKNNRLMQILVLYKSS